MKVWIMLSFLFCSTMLCAQWTENFGADWSNNWQGQLHYWESVDGNLKSKGPAISGTCLELERPVLWSDSFEMMFVLNLKLATSSNNYFQLDLTENDSGIRLQWGGLKDNLELEVKRGTQSTNLYKSADKLLGSSSSNPVAIKLKYCQDSLFLRLNSEGDTNALAFAGAFRVDAFTADLLKLRACYSSSNAEKFYLDYLRFSNPIYDQEPPRLKHACAYASGRVEFEFNEQMDTTFGQFKPELGANIFPQWTGNQTCYFILHIDSGFSVQAIGFQDIAGNIMIDSSLILYPEPVQVHRIQVSEFMRDPTPSLGLPEIEWLELVNSSEMPIALQTLKIGDEKGQYAFPEFQLLPGDYIILTSAGNCKDLEVYGRCLELDIPSSFLSNGEDVVYVFNSFGDTLDALYYNNTWNLSEGGVSMEKMDLKGTCAVPQENFAPSISSFGGTPGQTNSMDGEWTDSLAPVLIDFFSVDGSTLRLIFSETPLLEPVVYFENSLCVVKRAADYFEAQLPFTLVEDAIKSYQFQVLGVQDCSGNRMRDSLFTFRYASLVIPERKDIMISEVFWDVLQNQSAFIEVYNRGKQALALGGLVLEVDDVIYEIEQSSLYPGETLLLCNPGEAAFFVHGKKVELNKKMKFSHRGSIQLSHPETGLLDELDYRENKFGKEWKASSGFSMQREDTALVCGYTKNWARSKIAGGSPGFLETKNAAPADELLEVKRWSLDAFGNLQAELNIAASANAFELTCSLYPGMTFSSKHSTNTKTLLFEGVFPRDSSFRLQCTAGEGCNGEQVDGVVYDFHPIGKGGIRLNELMFAPMAHQSEFIELFNTGDSAIELQGLMIGDCDASGIPEKPFIICDKPYQMQPGSFLVLTDQAHALDRDYPIQETSIIRVDEFPSLSNSGSCVVLYDSLLNVMDSFHYTSSMHDASLINTNGVSLERINPYFLGPQSSNWVSASSLSNSATPGRKNSQFSSNKEESPGNWHLLSGTFSPDGDGYEDFALLEFSDLSPGTRLDLEVYSPSANLVYVWENNRLCGSTGLLRWDGKDKDGNSLPNGAYILLIQYTSPGQRTRTKRLVIVKAGSGS